MYDKNPDNLRPFELLPDPGPGLMWATESAIDDNGVTMYYRDIVPIPDAPGSDGSGRAQFASEAERDYAMAEQARMETSLMPEQHQMMVDRLAADLEQMGFDREIAIREAKRLDSQLALQAFEAGGRLTLGQEENEIRRLAYESERELGLGELDLGERSLDEDIRSNLVREGELAKSRGLSSIEMALSGYLRATELKDARKLAALQETRAFLPSMVDPSQEFFLDPSGPLGTSMGNYGLPFGGTEVQHMEVDPTAMGTGIDDFTMQQINDLLTQGAQ
jgi:hypothetical protein